MGFILKNRKGEKHGRLLVVRLAQRNPVKWWCHCDCGKMKKIRATDLCTNNPTQSCGCLQKEKVSEFHHTRTLPPFVRLFTAMKADSKKRKQGEIPFFLTFEE